MQIRIVDVSEVVVPEGRFRQADEKTVAGIIESLDRFGQLQPIIVENDMSLVDGLHRLEAMKKSGRSTVAAVFRDEADELFIREMELEVNIRRKEMTWQERERAIVALHEMKMSLDHTWTAAQTAALAGTYGGETISRSIKLVKMMDAFPELETAKSVHQATSWGNAKAAAVLRVFEVKDNHIDYGDIESKIVLGDSVEVIKTIPNGSFRAIITDPPFGVNYDNRVTDKIGTMSDYEDSEDSYERLLSMAPDLYRVLKDDGWLIWFFGISWYSKVKDVFRDAGFIVDEIPVIWDRSDGRTYTTRPDRYFGRGYDVALHCVKGSPEMIQRSKSNVLRIPPLMGSDKELLVERPVELYEELIRRLTVPGERVADFFVGSGSCPAACAKLGRDYFGVERDAERRAFAIQKIFAHTPQQG